jgi:hypothetical protein
LHRRFFVAFFSWLLEKPLISTCFRQLEHLRRSFVSCRIDEADLAATANADAAATAATADEVDLDLVFPIAPEDLEGVAIGEWRR